MAARAPQPVRNVRPGPRRLHERAGTTGRLCVLGLSADAAIVTELERRGHRPRCHGELASLLSSWAVGGPVALVATFGGQAAGCVPLDALLALRRLCPSLPIVLLALDASPEEWHVASQITTACHDAALPPQVLSVFIEAAVGAASVAPCPDRAGRCRSVVLRLWDSVEIDGRPVYLGVAERNFLFLLAGRAGQRIGKTERIDVGGGRTLSAAACRRRLGQRLSPELTAVLVPQQRFEPYRFREPAEVDAFTRDANDGTPTRLRVLGRGEVSLIPVGLLDSVA